MHLEKVLENYGLKERHATVYLACLELGSASILRISQKASIPRSTTEVVLESLQDKGLVSSFRKKRIRYFSAEDPHKVISLAKDKASLLELALPQFVALYGKSKIHPTVRFYNGTPQMKLILEEMLTEAREIYTFSSAQDLFTVIPEYNSFVQKRITLKIPVKVILRDSPKARERKQLGPGELREVKIISESYDYHGIINIWQNKVAMFSFEKDLTALVVESTELAQMQRSFFMALWNKLAQ